MLFIFFGTLPLYSSKASPEKANILPKLAKTIISWNSAYTLPLKKIAASQSRLSHLPSFVVAPTPPYVFFSMLETYLFGSKKPQNRLCVHSQKIFHVVSLLSHHLDQASSITFLEFVPPFTRIVFVTTSAVSEVTGPYTKGLFRHNPRSQAKPRMAGKDGGV